jgi:hypothetical protein
MAASTIPRPAHELLVDPRKWKLDSEMRTQHDLIRDLKRALALQAVYTTGCCQRALSVAKGKLASAGVQKRAHSDKAWPGSELDVGFIGCGMLGGALAHSLLDAGISPASLMISTRTPTRQRGLAERGAQVFFDNARVAARAHVLFVAILPAQLPAVVKELRGVLTPRTLVLSVVAGTPPAKLAFQLGVAPTAVLGLGADATLALLPAAHAARVKMLVQQRGAAPDVSPSVPDFELVELAAEGLLPDEPSATALLRALPTVLHGVDFPSATPARAVAAEALFGPTPHSKLVALSTRLIPESGWGEIGEDGAGEDDDGPLDLLRERFARVLEPPS